MHVKSLKVFCDVVARRSFSKAASENRISQSGASQIVHQLEDGLGLKLLDRSKRPFVLTREGEVYYEGCRKLVQRYYALEDEVRAMHEKVEGRVQVASIYSVGLSYGRWLLDEFARRYPEANVHIEYHHPDRIYDLVAEDQADMGLVSFAQPSRAIAAVEWCEEPMPLVCAPGHPLAVRREVDVAELQGLEIVGFDPHLRIRRRIDRALQEQGVEVVVTMAFDNIDTIKRAIEVSNGASFLPEPALQAELRSGSLVRVPVNGLCLKRPLGIIYRRGVELGTTAKHFMNLLQNFDQTAQSTDDGAAMAVGFEHQDPLVAAGR